MSQIDKVAYLPLLFFFIIIFILFYLFVFSYFLKFFLIAFNTRNRLFDTLITFSINCYSILSVFSFFIGININAFFFILSKNALNIFVSYYILKCKPIFVLC